MVKAIVLMLVLAVPACGSDSAQQPPDTGSTVDALADTADTSAACVDATAATATRQVVLGAAFEPACLQIRVGQTVRWVGDATKHVPTDGRTVGPFAAIGGDDTYWSAQFKEVGIYPYYDEKNPSVRGEIRVVM